MVTPVSHNSSFWPSLSDFFEPADSSDTSFLPQDSSWGKYATPALQAARLFSPGLDIGMDAGELLTFVIGLAPAGSQPESHSIRNLLIVSALVAAAGAALTVRHFGFGSHRWMEFFLRRSGGPKQVATEVARASGDLRLALRIVQPRSPIRLSFFDDQVWIYHGNEELGRVLTSVSEPGLLDRLSQFICAQQSGALLKYVHVTEGSKSRLVIFHPQSEHAAMMRNLLREMPDARLRAAGRIQVVKNEVAIDIASKFNITANGESLAYPTGMGGYHVMNDGQISDTVVEDAGLSGFDVFLKGIFGNSVNVKLEGNRAVDAFIRRQNN